MVRELLASAPGATVVLSGPGGGVSAALAIGGEIRDRRLATLVPAGADCASACSLIWLAGQRERITKRGQPGWRRLA